MIDFVFWWKTRLQDGETRRSRTFVVVSRRKQRRTTTMFFLVVSKQFKKEKLRLDTFEKFSFTCPGRFVGPVVVVVVGLTIDEGFFVKRGIPPVGFRGIFEGERFVIGRVGTIWRLTVVETGDDGFSTIGFVVRHGIDDDWGTGVTIDVFPLSFDVEGVGMTVGRRINVEFSSFFFSTTKRSISVCNSRIFPVRISLFRSFSFSNSLKRFSFCSSLKKQRRRKICRTTFYLTYRVRFFSFFRSFKNKTTNFLCRSCSNSMNFINWINCCSNSLLCNLTSFNWEKKMFRNWPWRKWESRMKWRNWKVSRGLWPFEFIRFELRGKFECRIKTEALISNLFVQFDSDGFSRVLFD